MSQRAQPRNRRSAARHRPRKARTAGLTALTVLFVCALALFVLVSPFEPTQNVSSGTVVDSATGEATSTSLHITEIMSSNHAAYPDERGRFSDWIELTNDGEQPINLQGFGLSDREDKIGFTFPDRTLAPGERVVVFASGQGQGEPTEAYHAPFKISSAGETVILFAPDGRAVEHIEAPAMMADMVYAKTPDGWIVSDMYTPGYENTQAGMAAFRASTFIETGTLLINEVCVTNRTALMDEDGAYSDWVELYNNSDRAVDLSAFALSDNPDKRVKWRFPKGAVIEPRGYFVVFASGKDRTGDETHMPHANFGLRAEKGAVLLSDIQGNLVDMTSYDLVPTDASWGRQEGGANTWQVFTQPTPGLPNNRAGALEMNRRMLVANTSGVAITEVMASNVNTALPNGEVGIDWVEIFNFGNETVSLGGYGFSDTVNRPRKWRFPMDTSIAPGQYLVVYCDGTDKSGNGVVRTSFRISSGGETLCISDPYGNILDKLVVPQLLPDITYGRTPGRDGLFYYANPTPGTLNGEGFDGFAQPPSFATPGGLFARPITLALVPPDGGQVRYTLDATEPTVSSPLYTEPIEIARTTVVRARSFQPGLNPSVVMTQTYFISVYHTTPVISLVTNPENVWNEETGMLTDGPLDRETWERPWYAKGRNHRDQMATFGKKLHYDGFMEFYETDGTQALSTGMNFHVMGQFSLDMPQKSFSVNAKKRFGTGYFEYPLFPDRPFERYKAIALRNGGQDGLYTRVIDGLQARLAASISGTTLLTQAWRPVSVYLNGQYWGHYNMRERINRYFVAQHEGWEDPDAMDVLEADGTGKNNINWGSNAEYTAMLNHIKDLDMTVPENIQYIIDRVDIDNMFDYFICEMYFGNTDPGNIRFYKKHGEGNKWRFILYDVDWGLFDSKNGGPSYVLNPKGMGSFRINNTLIRKTLENPQMRDKFLRRLGEIFQTTFTPENILALMNEMVEQIKPEQAMHQGRWAEEMPKQVSFDVPKNPEGAYNYWLSRVARAHNVINKRPNIFWGMVQECFGLSDAQMTDYLGPRPELPPEQ